MKYNYTLQESASGEVNLNPTPIPLSYNVTFSDVAFAPVLLANITDTLNAKNKMTDVYAGWYMNGRNVEEISSSSDNSYAQEVLKLSNATNPTNANLIANPTVVGTFEWD